MRLRLAVIVSIVGIVWLLVRCSDSPQPEPAAGLEEPAGQLLVNQGPDSVIVELDLASGAARQVSAAGELAASARWSPDGRQIAMAQQVFRRIRVVIVDADGTPVSAVDAPIDVDESVPSWSPDCRSLAVGRFSDQSASAWIASLDGGASQSLGAPDHVSGLDWSAATDRIAMYRLGQPYGSLGDESSEAPVALDEPDRVGILTMEADGSDLQVMAGTEPGDEWPRWSPDGSLVAFDREVNGVRQVFVVDDRGNVEQLTNGAEDARLPIWSPDGEWLAYSSGEAATDDGVVALIRADGSDERVLSTRGTPTDWGPHGGSCPQIGALGRSLP